MGMTGNDNGQAKEQQTQLAGQEQVSSHHYAAKSGGVRLFRDLNELEARELQPQPTELIPGFWRLLPGVVAGKIQDLVNWARQNSNWIMPFGTACCGMELAAFIGNKFDFDRFGMVPWFSPRQCDTMIVAGTITEKMAPAVVQLYNQMAEPRWVIAMGGCAINGGPFCTGYNVVDGVDKLIPVDVYVPGCPPRPEALIHGIYALRDKIARAGKLYEARKEAVEGRQRGLGGMPELA